MKSNYLFLVFLFFSFFILNHISCSSITNLAYVYNYQIQKGQGSSQIVFQSSVRNPSLKKALQKLNKIQALIQQKAEDLCKDKKQKSNPCTYKLQKKYEVIQPLYKLQQKQTIFSAFDVSYQLILTVNNNDKIPHLIDDILSSIKQIRIISIQKVVQNENQIYEKAVKLGIQQGQRLCSQMNGQLINISKVSQVDEFQVVDLQGQQYQQQEQQNQESDNQNIANQPEVMKISFQAQCSLN